MPIGTARGRMGTARPCAPQRSHAGGPAQHTLPLPSQPRGGAQVWVRAHAQTNKNRQRARPAKVASSPTAALQKQVTMLNKCRCVCLGVTSITPRSACYALVWPGIGGARVLLSPFTLRSSHVGCVTRLCKASAGQLVGKAESSNSTQGRETAMRKIISGAAF